MRALSLSALVVVAALLCGCKSPVFNIATKQQTPRPPTLTMAEFVSHTVDAKERDTGVYVYVTTKNKATALASVEDADRSDADATRYEPGSDHRIRLLVASPGSTKEECKKFRVTVKAKAPVENRWKFDGRVVLTFSDGTNLEEQKQGIVLESKDGQLAEANFGG